MDEGCVAGKYLHLKAGAFLGWLFRIPVTFPKFETLEKVIKL
jgi:hypothetical protein